MASPNHPEGCLQLGASQLTRAASPRPISRRAVGLHPVVFVAFTLLAAPASANDSSFGGSGADLQPLQETRVQMQSEDIVMDLRFDRRVGWAAWHITASYRFHNPTAAPVALQMGFPEQHCDEGWDCNGKGGKFRDLKITARGAAVKHRIGTVSKDHKWAPSLGQVYLFDVSFAPGETVQIVHRYTYDVSTSVEGQSVEYLTTTGALWNGPIGHARFTLRTPWRPWMVTFLPDFTLTAYTEKPGGKKGSATEMVFEAKGWTPKRNFAVVFPNQMNATNYFPGAASECPSVERFRWEYEKAPKAAQKSLTATVAKLDKATRRICRNMPYAHHGYSFKSKALGALFYRGVQTGYGVPYFPTAAPGTGTFEKQPWSYTVFRQNPHYTPALLAPEEGAYVRAVKAAEGR